MSTEISTASPLPTPQNTRAATPVQPRAALPKETVVGSGKPAAEPAAPKADPQEMQRHLDEALAKLNEQMKQSGRDLNFSRDPAADRTIITVRSSQTGEVIRQIPDATLLRVAHNIEQVKGMLLNERV